MLQISDISFLDYVCFQFKNLTLLVDFFPRGLSKKSGKKISCSRNERFKVFYNLFCRNKFLVSK